MLIAIDYLPEAFDKVREQCKNGAVPPISPGELRRLPPQTRIVAGNNSKDFGGGISGTGYVMQGGKGTHSIHLGPEDIAKRFVQVR